MNSSKWVMFPFLPPANKVWGKVICLQACVCPQGRALPDQVHPPQEETPPPAAGADTTPPGPGKLPPGADTPPKTRYTPQDQVHPPGPGTPPGADTPPRPGTPLWDQVHRACWEIRTTRGRYASYWNAILFVIAMQFLFTLLNKMLF